MGSHSFNKGEAYHSATLGPVIYLGAEKPTSRPSDVRYLVRSVFLTPASAPVAQSKTTISLLISIPALHDTIALLQAKLDGEVPLDISYNARKAILAQGDLPTVVKLLKALERIGRDPAQENDFNKGVDYIARTIGGHAVATRFTEGSYSMPLARRKQYLDFARLIIFKMLAGTIGPIELRHFYNMEAVLPKVGDAPVSAKTKLHTPLKAVVGTTDTDCATPVVSDFKAASVETRDTPWTFHVRPKPTLLPDLPSPTRADGLPWYGRYPGESRLRRAARGSNLDSNDLH